MGGRRCAGFAPLRVAVPVCFGGIVRARHVSLVHVERCVDTCSDGAGVACCTSQSPVQQDPLSLPSNPLILALTPIP